GKVEIGSPAPAGGANVTLASSNPLIAAVAASITVPAGETSQIFGVNTSIIPTGSTVSISANYSGQTKTTTLRVMAAPADLQIVAISPPPNILTDTPLNIKWQEKNDSTGKATAPWVDRIFLSQDDRFGDDRLLTELTVNQSLDPGQTVERSQSVTIPLSL